MATNNKFSVLDDEVSMKSSNSTPLDMRQLQETISYAVVTATGEPDVSNSKSQSVRPKVKDVPVLNDGLRGSLKSEDGLVSDIVSKVLVAVQPVIVEAVRAAVTTAMSSMMATLKDVFTEMIMKDRDRDDERAALSWQKEVDRLEQYSRRENVRVFGLPEGPGKEDTSAEVVKLASDMGLHLKKEDISVSHRLPGRGKGPQPVIVKFVRRSTKVDMLRAKKKLKHVDGRSKVFVEEDLTPLRSKMLKAVRQDAATKSAWSIDGKIFCIVKKKGKEEKISVDSVNDLKKLGFSSTKINDIVS